MVTNSRMLYFTWVPADPAALRALVPYEVAPDTKQLARVLQTSRREPTDAVRTLERFLHAAEGPGEHERFLAVAFPDAQMQVLPYNRVVRDLNGLSPDAFVAALGARVTVTPGGPATPARKGLVAMYLGGAWYTLDFGPVPPGTAAEASLDVSRLQDGVLGPVLGIHDIRTDKRIDFVGGIRGTAELETLVNGGTFAVAFSHFPVSVDDLMRISDAGGLMPPKSTWFEPKLRDGLLTHLIQEPT